MQTKKPNHIWFILLIGAALIAIAGTSRIFGPHEVIPWRDDFESAVKESAATHKPIFAFFTAEWCGPCQELKRTTWADKDVEKLLRDYVPVKIDIDAHPDLAKRYVEDSIPRFVVIGPDQAMVKALDGYLDAGDFVSWLKS